MFDHDKSDRLPNRLPAELLDSYLLRNWHSLHAIHHLQADLVGFVTSHGQVQSMPLTQPLSDLCEAPNITLLMFVLLWIWLGLAWLLSLAWITR